MEIDWSVLYGIAMKYGYLGAWVASLFGNLVPFIPVPYLLVIFFMSANVKELNPLMLGLISGIGGGMGKIVTYYLGRGAVRLVYGKGDEKLNALRKLIGNYGALAMFIFASTPSPDDLVIMILGMIKYSLAKFFLACTAGKVVISVITAYFGKAYRRFVFYIGANTDLLFTAVSIGAFLLISYFIFKVDWVKVLAIVEEGGWRKLVGELKRKGLRAVV